MERRRTELAAQGHGVDAEGVRGEIELRDRLDSEREDSPLRSASDAVTIDTAGLDVDGVVRRIIEVLGA